MVRTEIYEDKKGEYRWRRRSGNRQIVSTSGEGYKTRYGAALAASKFAITKERDWLLIAVLLALLIAGILLLSALWSLAAGNDKATPTQTSQSGGRPAPLVEKKEVPKTEPAAPKTTSQPEQPPDEPVYGK